MAKKRSSRPKKKSVEQYDHSDKQRPNNPPVGLVTPGTDPSDGESREYEYDPHLDPQLVWTGKAERTSFDVPTVSLHVHERIDPKTIIHAVRTNGNGAGEPDASASGSNDEPHAPAVRHVQRSLFEQPASNPPLRDALDFYRHAHGWTNRLIAGDSLLVMNSLLEKEGMAGKVQMIYIDPPYGIRYGSNFQPFVGRRDVKDGRDSDLTQEPEMVKAFRDTWELGIHSYLTYLRDRLLLARELLHESGSVFVQISDENLHHVREVMDELLGADNIVSVISFRTKIPLNAAHLPNIADYLVWYAKDKSRMKFRRLFNPREQGVDTQFSSLELPDGRVVTARKATQEEKTNGSFFTLLDLMATGYTESCHYEFELAGRTATPNPTTSWKTTPQGMANLKLARRVRWQRTVPRYVFFANDYPVTELTNQWTDTQGAVGKSYAVQTSNKVLERCILMTTDPGDLVVDPTCGSGTTAHVAEHWGRRWITCDTSRVATTLAKQRLMTASFDYYKLAHPDEGVGSGFPYKTVPHVTLGSIANNPEIREGMTREEIDAAIAKYADQETLYDQPLVDRSRVRITGPFTVEAVPASAAGVPEVRPIDECSRVSPKRDESRSGSTVDSESEGVGELHDRSFGETPLHSADASIARSGQTLRLEEWRSELARTGVRAKGGRVIRFARLEPLPGGRCIHAVGETAPPEQCNPISPKSDADECSRVSPKPDESRSESTVDHEPESERDLHDRSFGETPLHSDDEPTAGRQIVAVSFGPEHAPLEQRQVELAWEEARGLSPRPDILLFAAFQFDPEAAKDVDELTPEKTGMLFLRSQMNTDLLTDDLKKKRSTNESFWLIGQPDVELRPAECSPISPKSEAGNRDDSAEPDGRTSESRTTGVSEKPRYTAYQVEIRGFDYYNPVTGNIESGDTSKIAMWMLDTDYDGRSLYPRQVFFPMSGKKDGWSRLAKNLKAEIDAELIEAYRGTVSLPFSPGEHKRVAVKIIDDRGIESLKIIEV